MTRAAAVALLTTGIVTGLMLEQPGLLTDVDLLNFDALMRVAGQGTPSGKVAIIAIDEASLQAYGRWPWPRRRLRELVLKAGAKHPAGILLDMVFPEPEEDREPGEGNDGSLGAALASTQAVIGYHLRFSGSGTRAECASRAAAPVMVIGALDVSKSGLFQASGVLCSVPAIAAAAAGAGFLNGAADHDGKLRRLPMLMAMGGSTYPSLTVAALARAGRGSGLVWETDGFSDRLRVGKHEIPVDARATTLLRFRGPTGAIPRIAAADLLADRVDEKDLAGRYLVIGATAMGMQDTAATPGDSFLPSVEVQATALDNILRGDAVRRTRMGLLIQLALLGVAGIATPWLLIRLQPFASVAAAVGIAVGLWGISALLLRYTNHFVSPLFPMLALLTGHQLVLLTGLITARRTAVRSEQQVLDAKKFMLSALQALASVRDSESSGHLLRIQGYLRLLCEAMKERPRYRRFLTAETIELIVQLAPIHDIGKVGIPDHILKKPGPLTSEEYVVMKQHVLYGYQVLERARQVSQMQDEALFGLARDLVASHHERWDGTGYPKGLRGEQIPMAGRLLAVADVYDALVSRRAYKPAMSHTAAVEIIVGASGKHFDPEVVDAFLRIQAEWKRVAAEYQDDAQGAGA